MKKVIQSLILTLVMGLSYSQTTYPKLSVLDKDTVCIITLNQMDSINVMFNELNGCIELNDTLYSRERKYQDVVYNQNRIIDLQNDKLAIMSRINEENRIQIKEHEALNKYQKRKIKFFKSQINVTFVAFLSSLTLYLLKVN